jgi:inner membrane protein
MMCTIMTHALVAVGLGKTFTARKMPWLFWELTVVLSVLPDLDVLAFNFGIPYEAFLGHRGFSHSLCFALFAGFLSAFLTYRYFALPWWLLGNFFFAVTASHGILDAFTNGGLGIAFFSPFDTTRYFFRWTPIEVSPIGMSFFSERGWQTMRSELLWVWLPTLVLVGGALLHRKVQAAHGKRP